MIGWRVLVEDVCPLEDGMRSSIECVLLHVHYVVLRGILLDLRL